MHVYAPALYILGMGGHALACNNYMYKYAHTYVHVISETCVVHVHTYMYTKFYICCFFSFVIEKQR